MPEPHTAELVGTRLIVWDPKIGGEIYRLGFYGKPVGVPKPKPDQEFTAPLMLDLMEGLYLLEKNVIRVVDSRTGKPLTKKELMKLAGKTYNGFEEAYRVYEELRNKNFVVTPGIKFGADFAVYEHGPGIDHAPFLISVGSNGQRLGSFEIVRAGRLATTVRKQFIISLPTKRAKKDNIKYLMFKWYKP